MINLGFARKDLNDSRYGGCSPCCSSDQTEKSDYDNEVVYPELELVGKQAEVMGISDYKLDDVIEITFKLKVKGLKKEERMVNGKEVRDLCLKFQVIEASDYTEAGEEKEENDSSGEEEDSPISTLLGRKS